MRCTTFHVNIVPHRYSYISDTIYHRCISRKWMICLLTDEVKESKIQKLGKKLSCFFLFSQAHVSSFPGAPTRIGPLVQVHPDDGLCPCGRQTLSLRVSQLQVAGSGQSRLQCTRESTHSPGLTLYWTAMDETNRLF